MPRVRYHYNEETCKYEPIIIRGRAFFRRVLFFLVASYCIGLGGLLYFNYKYPSWDETELQNEKRILMAQWRNLDDQVRQASDRLAELEYSDDNTYRTILDLNPLDSTERAAGVGGREQEAANIFYPAIRGGYEKIAKLDARLDIEKQSFDKLLTELHTKEKKWASTPALTPIANKDLIRLHTTFGMRLHPILGYWREHRGLDLTAPKNAPVYATGDGYVHMAYYSDTYGQVVYLRHGFGYETRYAHLTRYIVNKGQRVQRGQVIGYVGTTGQSDANHLHYEVLLNGSQVNPMNFFHRYLSNEEYQKLVDQAKVGGPPLD
jgi:murein DD-endopeptidase MepM/ murein hydrolase activator NlpD